MGMFGKLYMLYITGKVLYVFQNISFSYSWFFLFSSLRKKKDSTKLKTYLGNYSYSSMM